MRTTRLLGLSTLTLMLVLSASGVASAQPMTAPAPAIDSPVVPLSIARPSASPLEAAQQERRTARLAEQQWLAATADHLPTASANTAEGFESSGFAQFMSSTAGRVLRVVAGAGMIVGGIAADSDLGTGIAIAGAVPLLAGTFDFCVLSPLFGGPLSGKAIRAAGK